MTERTAYRDQIGMSDECKLKPKCIRGWGGYVLYCECLEREGDTMARKIDGGVQP